MSGFLLPDYADWLTPERLAIEEAQWAQSKQYARYAAQIDQLVRSLPPSLTSVPLHIAEIGGGTGLIPQALDSLWEQRSLHYTLVDRNPDCLALASARNADRSWVTVVNSEIREYHPIAPIVVSFATLKHFLRSEWKDLFVQLFGECEHGIFSMAVAPEFVEDSLEFGGQFIHTRVPEAFIYECITDIGAEVCARDDTDLEEPIFTIRRTH